MLRYALRRLLIAIPTLFVIITIAFFMMRAAPGSPFDTDRQLPAAIEQNIRAAYGMDKPLIAQYGDYLSKVVRGDLGPSLKYRDKTVTEIIAEGFPVSMTIGVASLFLAMVFGVGLGVAAALRQNRPADFGAMAVAMIGISIPTFVTGPLLALVFGVWLRVLPSGGLQGGMSVQNLLLPVITLALPQIAIISRLTRASMIEVIRSNYIRTARAKGLSEWRVITRHAMRAALLPLVSYMGPALAALMTGSLVVEQVFQLPGIGRQFVIGALQRDYTVVMGVVILYAALIILMNLLADLLYGVLDPKVKYQ
ncbi:MAG: ABC transporter permease subunit [Euryhalocaulis sp.]|uniref:ABC transporter permease n=1 Tax=Euryhalocaulis sp. TaxID=2744307 RepID=UPI001844C6AA|nr:ABC transporter permease subunit [Euryhalocaulis sp.]MBA4802655.1 ABC transporter permease subunit [Euryhalocaulis sp.]